MEHDRSDQATFAIHLASNEIEGPATIRHQDALSSISERLDEAHEFKKGQFVQWKPGLKNRTFPNYGEPAIVRAVLPLPIFDPVENSASSPYFQEPLSLIIGVIREGDFLEFRMDSRRFEPLDN